MVRRDTPNNAAAWSNETLRPIRGSIVGSDSRSTTLICSPCAVQRGTGNARGRWPTGGSPNVFALKRLVTKVRPRTFSAHPSRPAKELAEPPQPLHTISFAARFACKLHLTADFAQFFPRLVFWPGGQLL